MRFLSMGEIRAKYPEVDDPDVLTRAGQDRALQAALEITRPQNWWGTGIPGLDLIRMSSDEGLPLCWVPPRALIVNLWSAGSREARRGVLMARSDEVVQSCREVLTEADDPWLAEVAPLAAEALDSWAEGRRAAGAALAVSVCDLLVVALAEPLVKAFDSEKQADDWTATREREEKHKRYPRASRLVSEQLAMAVTSPVQVRNAAALAPVSQFFERWHPSDGVPPPFALSRHVVAHQPAHSYLTGPESLVAVMLAASLTREMQERCEEIRSSDPDT